MDQAEFTTLYCARPENFAWFLGAGSSRTAGLPTAGDIIWDLKKRHYCAKENQEISRQDIQNDAVRTRIQSYMDSHGFPAEWAAEEYSTYFEKIFGSDRERQRKYLRAILAEDKVSLSIGNRVLGALLASGRSRIVFTTNFDSVVEKSVAEIGTHSLAAYHLEGSAAANQALNNEEFPIYCKLHGDFRYESLKNLSSDLAKQNDALAQCLVNAANRFGFVVTGYSGRDASVMTLFYSVLDTSNPFPHGLYWTGIKGSPVHPAVQRLLNEAQSRGITAEYIPIETFDSFMLRLWRNLPGKTDVMDKLVRKSRLTTIQIPLPATGKGKPLIRMNALPVVSMPEQCLRATFATPKDWSALQQAKRTAPEEIILTLFEHVLFWGATDRLRALFGDDLKDTVSYNLPKDLASPQNRAIKGFAEEALCRSLAKEKPLLFRTLRNRSFLAADTHPESRHTFAPVTNAVGALCGIVPNLTAPITEEHPVAERVSWTEAVRVSIDVRNGQTWLLLDPDIWIFPKRARKAAAAFMEARRGNRYNAKYNELLDAWIEVVLGTKERNIEVPVSPFTSGQPAENPTFTIGSRTAFSLRLSS